MPLERETKYTAATTAFVLLRGHATNADILDHLRQRFPDLSATTVHRITSRMIERGEFAIAPPTKNNVLRIDSKRDPHDHFQCIHCDGLRDVHLPSDLTKALQQTMGDCKLTGQLTIQGTCANCLKRENP